MEQKVGRILSDFRL